MCLLGLAACAGGQGDPPQAVPPTDRGSKGIEAVVSAEGTTLTVETDLLPVEGATGRCAVEVDPWVEEDAEIVHVHVGWESEAGPVFDGCEVATRTITLELAEPIGARQVRDGLSAIFWQEDGAWVGCGHVVMTCVPGPATCDNVADMVANMDVPQGTAVSVHGCDGTWAVADADMAARDCPAGDAACARVDRMFLFVTDDGQRWDVLYRDRQAGCGDVATYEPAFPVGMCEGLPVP
jgi:hypothetical protein